MNAAFVLFINGKNLIENYAQIVTKFLPGGNLITKFQRKIIVYNNYIWSSTVSRSFKARYMKELKINELQLNAIYINCTPVN